MHIISIYLLKFINFNFYFQTFFFTFSSISIYNLTKIWDENTQCSHFGIHFRILLTFWLIFLSLIYSGNPFIQFFHCWHLLIYWKSHFKWELFKNDAYIPKFYIYVSIYLYEPVYIYLLIFGVCWLDFHISYLPYISHIQMICSFVNLIVRHNSRKLWSNQNEKCFWIPLPVFPNHYWVSVRNTLIANSQATYYGLLKFPHAFFLPSIHLFFLSFIHSFFPLSY